MLSSQELSQLKNYPSTTLISYNVTKKYEKKNLKQETGKEATGWKLWTDTREALKFEVSFSSVFFALILKRHTGDTFM